MIPTDRQQRSDLRSLFRRRRDGGMVRLVFVNGNVTQVATELGKVRSQVQRWFRKYGIDPERYRI